MQRSQITIDGRTYVLPKEEADVERLVRKAHAAKLRADAAAEEFVELKKELIAVASGRRGKSGTVALGMIGLTAKVQFAQSVSFDPDALNPAREILGDEEFDKLFARHVRYTAKKALELFLKKSGDVVAKNLIQKALVVKDSAPRVTFGASEDDAG